jgi:hypothetical protein
VTAGSDAVLETREIGVSADRGQIEHWQSVWAVNSAVTLSDQCRWSKSPRKDRKDCAEHFLIDCSLHPVEAVFAKKMATQLNSRGVAIAHPDF